MTALLLLLAACAQDAQDAQYAQKSEVIRDIDYAGTGQKHHRLDLYLPKQANPPKLVIWIHGGAWRRGSNDKVPVRFLVDEGFAVASIEYRLSPVAKFPALVHDIKAGIRFLRAHADKYGYDAAKIGITGSSAGGHLVALVGTTNGHEELEGTVGKHLDQSSDVHAIVDYYGPTNFMTILKQSTPHGLSVRVPALELLLGDRPENAEDLAKFASPVNHVDPKDPPLMLIHGDQDPQVPINQSHELHAKYKNQKLEVHFDVVHGGAHGGKGFFDDDKRNARVTAFFGRHLR